jgi:hypothetical protein
MHRNSFILLVCLFSLIRNLKPFPSSHGKKYSLMKTIVAGFIFVFDFRLVIFEFVWRDRPLRKMATVVSLHVQNYMNFVNWVMLHFTPNLVMLSAPSLERLQDFTRANRSTKDDDVLPNSVAKYAEKQLALKRRTAQQGEAECKRGPPFLCHTFRVSKESFHTCSAAWYQLACSSLKSQSYSTTDSQSECLGIEPTVVLVTRYYFLSEVAVLSLLGALSDERKGLQFAV